ncbi:hypothetical protein Tco_0897537 [Tanacetum coccineum]
MVAYLLKPEGSEDFQQIVDFLNTSHIKYALTEKPTIHVSLIQEFWHTASASTSENREMEITATIDGRVKTITEASIRRHLKLEDSDGISTLPNTEIFEQLALMGPKKTSWEQFSSNIATAIICLATNRTFNFSRMIFEGMVKNLDSPNLQGQGSTIQSDSHHTTTSAPSTSQPPTSPPSMQISLYCRDGCTFPLDSPLLRFYYLEVLRAAISSLYRMLKKDTSKQGRSMIENLDQDAGVSLVQIDAEDQGRFEDETDTQEYISTSSGGISTAEELVSTVGASMPVSTTGMDQGSIPSPSASKDKGKVIMTEFKTEQDTTKLKQRQEIAGYQAAIRLQEQLDEEESQRIAKDAEVAQRLQEEIDAKKTENGSTDEDLVQQLQAGEKYSEEDLPMKLVELVNQRKKFFAQQRAEAKRNKPMTPAQQKGLHVNLHQEPRRRRVQSLKSSVGGSETEKIRKRKELSEESLQNCDDKFLWKKSMLKLYRVGDHTEAYQTFDDKLKKFNRDDLDKLWSLVKEGFSSTDPTGDKERILKN